MASPQDWSANLTTVVTNVTVLATFAGIVVAGIMAGMKQVREFKKPDAAATGQASQIAAATILENVTLSAWTESNKVVAIALDRLCDVITKQRDELQEHRHEMVEHRQAIEQWRYDLRHPRG